jgi:predicted MPP superfamily phosphohydrolase
VSDAPSFVDEIAKWAEQRAEERGHRDRPARERDDDGGPRGRRWRRNNFRYGIELRRFAGPLAYTEQLSQLRIAHLTDLHVGRVTPYAVQRTAVQMTNDEHPDLVVLTGDFVCHSQLYLDQLVEVVSAIDAPKVAVLGNHDYWSGADEVARALKRGGVEVLRNQNTTVELGHQRLQIVGLDDAYTSHADMDAAVKGLRHDLPALALSHIAEEADRLWRHGVPLVLSGHTHGGQVTLARLHEFAVGKIGGHRYVHGLYGSRKTTHEVLRSVATREQDQRAAASSPANEPVGAVYVGAGIGAAVMPLRLGDRGRREVTIFELGTVPGTFEEHHTEQPALPGRRPSEAVIAKRAAKVIRKRLMRESRGLGGRH